MKKKVIAISGGSDGLGKAVAKALSPDHIVVILARSESKLKSVAKSLKCEYEVCDITDPISVEKAINNIIQKHKRIDCLVNNAGNWVQGELDTTSSVKVQENIKTNLTGHILLTKTVIPLMKKQKGGLIIFVNSQAGLYGKAERSVYNAGKWGLTGLTRSLQQELSQYNIAVTGFYPGKMKTGMFKKIGIEKEMSNALDLNIVAKTIKFIVENTNKSYFPEVGINYLGYSFKK